MFQLDRVPGVAIPVVLSEEGPGFNPQRLRHSDLAFWHGDIELRDVALGPEHPLEKIMVKMTTNEAM